MIHNSAKTVRNSSQSLNDAVSNMGEQRPDVLFALRAAPLILLLLAILQLSSGNVCGAKLDQQTETKDKQLIHLKAKNKKVAGELRGHRIIFHCYIPENWSQGNGPIVLHTSGAGGWHAFDDHIATVLAGAGIPVYGISIRGYLNAFYSSEEPATAEKIGRDYYSLIHNFRSVSGVSEQVPVILSGWSLGAGYSLIASSDPRTKPLLYGIVSVAVSQENESFYSLLDALKSRLSFRTRGPFIDAATALGQAMPTPVSLIQAERDKSASPEEARRLMDHAALSTPNAVRLFVVQGAHSHSFAGGRENFDAALTQALNWIASCHHPMAPEERN